MLPLGMGRHLNSGYRNGSHVVNEAVEFIKIVMLCKVAPFLFPIWPQGLFLVNLTK